MSTTLRDIDEAPGRIMAPTKTNNKAERGILPHASLPLSQNGSPTKAVMFTKGKSLTSLGSSQMRPGTGRNSGLLDITNRSTSAQDKSPKGRLERVKSLSADRWDLDLIIHRAEAHGHDKYEVRQKFKKELQYAQETYPSESQAWHQWLAESLTYNVYCKSFFLSSIFVMLSYAKSGGRRFILNRNRHVPPNPLRITPTPRMSLEELILGCRHHALGFIPRSEILGSKMGLWIL